MKAIALMDRLICFCARIALEMISARDYSVAAINATMAIQTLIKESTRGYGLNL